MQTADEIPAGAIHPAEAASRRALMVATLLDGDAELLQRLLDGAMPWLQQAEGAAFVALDRGEDETAWGLADALAAHGDVEYTPNAGETFGARAGTAGAIAVVAGRDLLLVDPDASWTPEQFDSLVTACGSPWGPMVAHRALWFGDGDNPGVARLYRREALLQIGCFDRNLPTLEAEDWIGRAIWAGWTGEVVPVLGSHAATCRRDRDAASPAGLLREARDVLRGKWGPEFWRRCLPPWLSEGA
jgi:hypothetical protein